MRWGVDPTWSRFVDAPSHDGATHRWHLLERAPAKPVGTIVCVHGNPTWSYLWRSFLHRLGDRYRVIAVDQLGMGFSDRTAPRRYADRVRDLADVLDALDVAGPVILAGQDWGGAVAMGWAVEHTTRTEALILCNTGIAIPAGSRGPQVIRLASKLSGLVGHHTRIFVDGTLALGRDRISSTAREGFRAPYRRSASRHAVAEFVADAPFDPRHPSAPALALVAERLGSLTCPALLAFGANDPVFGDGYADDLAGRMPQADRHRFPLAGHLVPEEADVAGLADRWLHERGRQPSAPVAPSPEPRPLWSALDDRRFDTAVAFLDGASGESISFRDLHRRVMRLAAGLHSNGVGAGDRVAVLVPPSVDLVVVVYACWRAGAVTVVADRGLGLRGLGRAVRSARVGHVIGPGRALRAAAALRWAPAARTFDVAGLGALELDAAPPPEPAADAPAAVLFTSGATGPAKGVRYTHGALAAQRDALRRLYGVTTDDRLVAAFAPFALLGPALGIASATPDCDVTKPGSLTAATLDAACTHLGATMAFGSPAALANVVATATASGEAAGLARLRLVMSAGAPVPSEKLRAFRRLAPGAELHTPYGMTEVLPVADIELDDIELAEAAGDPIGGVCVGRPVPGVVVMVAPLGADAVDIAAPVPTGHTGDVLVNAPWLSAGYDLLWRTEIEARPRDANGVTWHRTGDVGHLDAGGRLWIEGRSVHVIDTADGAVTPVPIERRVEAALGLSRSAAVGVGPTGCQQLVVVIESSAAEGLVTADVAASVRATAGRAVAAVLTKRALPVDIRHNAKVDRLAVAAWAARLLAGRGGTP